MITSGDITFRWKGLNADVSPTVTIIVPTYNTPVMLLRDCIDSILKQTYEDFEVIIVDDGSNAPVSETLGDEAKDVRISILRQENRGVSAARNLGISKTRGKYVAFVDADDCMEHGWLSYAFALAEKETADIVYGKVQRCLRCQIANVEPSSRPSKVKVYKKDDIKFLQIYLLHGRSVADMDFAYLDLGPCGKLFRYDKIRDIRFPEDIRISEDQVFNHAALKRCTRYIITDRLAYYYIENEGSVSHRFQADAIDTVVHAMEEIRPYLCNDVEVMQAFRYRIVEEMFNALQFSCFFDNKKTSIKKQMAGIEYAKSQSLIQDALRYIDKDSIPSKKCALKVGVIKNFPMLFVVYKRIFASR